MNVAKQNRPLTDAEIFAVAPAVFGTMPHPHMSDRYSFVSTHRLMEEARESGYHVISAQQVSARTDIERQTAPHQLWLTRADDLAAAPVGRMFSCLRIQSSHNGVKKAEASLMLYRKACMNGMCIPTSIVGGVSVKHKQSWGGDGAELTISDAICDILRRSAVVDEIRQQWEGITTTQDQRHEYARRVNIMRAEITNSDPVIDPLSFLRIRRASDGGLDLATLYNVTEENLRLGGARLAPSANGRLRSTRAIQGFDTLDAVHNGLFELTREFARSR